MTNRVYSFSVKSTDTQKLAMIQELKDQCDKTGVSFSHVVLKGLQLVKEAENDRRRS
jgi:hypothetical protein